MGRLQDALEPLGRRLRRRSPDQGPPQAPPGAQPPSGAAPGTTNQATQPGASPYGTAAAPPSFKNRARLRRRLRYLRQTRELGFRDLGGFVFDAKRLGRDRDDIVQAKLDALSAIDRELRALEIALADVQELHLLHEPGISVCPRCGALHGSEDNYCPACGLPLGRGLGLAIAQGGPGGAVAGSPPTPAHLPTAAPAAPPAPAKDRPDSAAEDPTTEQPSVAKQ